MIAVCENLYRSYRHVVVFNNKLARTHKHVTRPHLASCAPHAGATPLRTRTNADPTTDPANLAAPPHLPHMCTRIAARTTADQHAAKPGVQKNARASGRTVVPERGARSRLRRCHRLGRSERPPLAAAGRAALRQNLRHVEEASCTHGPAHPCAERARVHGQPAARGSMRASRRQGTGERASKGAPRGDARTVEMCSVPELVKIRRLSARAAARTSRAPPPGGS